MSKLLATENVDFLSYIAWEGENVEQAAAAQVTQKRTKIIGNTTNRNLRILQHPEQSLQEALESARQQETYSVLQAKDAYLSIIERSLNESSDDDVTGQV